MKSAPGFQPVCMDTWPRKPYFDHFFTDVRCTYSITANIDITEILKICASEKVKLYPAMIYCISNAINSVEEMRTCFNESGQLGTWSAMSPCYTVFHKADSTFSNVWTEYHSAFATFYSNYQTDILKYGEQKAMDPKPDMPDNTFPLSCIPWVDFTGFNINVFADGSYLRPILTLGQYTSGNDRAVIPLAVQVHHAVCDGYHVGRFFGLVRRLAETPGAWLQTEKT